MKDELPDLIRFGLQMLGRIAIPMELARGVVGDGAKQIKAFNLSDGTRTQSEIAKKARVDPGNLSRSSARWVQNGVASWLGTGRDARLIHIYPIPAATRRKKA